ncbi:hypothetical protein [Clostridium sp.]|uniref:hypothetical protein n=1 Tax=Clostridium sp. TaxID=1506 RepID=UPI002FCB242A
MGDNKFNTDISTVEKQNELALGTMKEYVTDSKELLDNLKMVQGIIQKSEGREIPFLIKVAQTNLTKTSIEQCKNMIIDLQVNFNDDGIALFIEKTISLVTAAETSNLIYGDLIKIKDLRNYLSNKTYNIVYLRTKKLLQQLKNTKYEDNLKLSFIVDNLNLCNKMFEYCWDIYPENIVSLEQTIVILNTLIKQRVKLGLDNYNVELVKVMINKNEEKICKIRNSKIELDINGQILSREKGMNNETLKSALDESLVITDCDIVSELVYLETGTEEVSLINASKNDPTDQFIEISNNVLREIKESAANDFISIAFQKFYSIVSAIETINYIKGIVIDKKKISRNISNIITEMIYSNYIAITESWNSIEEKSEEDYIAYSKEILNYSKMLFEAYEMNKDNIDALHKSIQIEIVLYKNKYNFKLNHDLCEKLRSSINKNTSLIKEVYPEFNGNIEIAKESKKKSFWSKIFK